VANIIHLFRSRSNPQQRFENLLRPHIEVLYRMAYRWTNAQDRAEDLVQELLIKLVPRVDEMEQIESLRPWLLRILYNRYVDDYRRARSSPIDANHSGWNPDDEEPIADAISQAVDPIPSGEQEELRQSLHKALSLLEPEQRDVVLLHDMEGYTAEEVAGIMEIQVGTVKSRLHRARARLKLLLFDDSG
jgi:RNA polymerase sigma-70 factor (ECF subfamily)